jgi:hypothetical protein
VELIKERRSVLRFMQPVNWSEFARMEHAERLCREERRRRAAEARPVRPASRCATMTVRRRWLRALAVRPGGA